MHAFGSLSRLYPDLHIIIAGGYDPRINENVEYLDELMSIAVSYTLFPRIFEKYTKSIDSTSRCVFIPSFTNDQKILLLKNAKCLVYTPSNEHFGIVPVEAMYSECPVIACNSGGPLESILEGETGFLVDPTETGFYNGIQKVLLMDKDDTRRMRIAAKSRVENMFSLVSFTKQLDQIINEMVQKKKSSNSKFYGVVFGILLLFITYYLYQ